MLYDAKNLAIHLLKSLFETGLRHYADHPGAFHDHPPPWPMANYLLPVTWKTKEPQRSTERSTDSNGTGHGESSESGIFLSLAEVGHDLWSAPSISSGEVPCENSGCLKCNIHDSKPIRESTFLHFGQHSCLERAYWSHLIRHNLGAHTWFCHSG